MKIFEDATNINEEKLVPLDPCLPQIPLEFKYNLILGSQSTSEDPSALALHVHRVFPKSVLNSSSLGKIFH
ncbi:hypothetical protein PIB30_099937 [Stylosanthes scabra]|uniref:Uncharacterized protein n=1 Tax=Stylosanthes scabra TaxID=79078 RepID=A0ABU6YXP3_9FABA|nr:hypothetical protein [Stylosanthes scabra]